MELEGLHQAPFCYDDGALRGALIYGVAATDSALMRPAAMLSS